MKKIQALLVRRRLITSVLALVLVLGALVVTPAEADIVIEQWDHCENGCVNWNQQNGCVTCQRCCTKNTGEWQCWLVASNMCP